MNKPRATKGRVFEAWHALNLRNLAEFGKRDNTGLYGYTITEDPQNPPAKRWELEFPGRGVVIPATSARKIIDAMTAMPH